MHLGVRLKNVTNRSLPATSNLLFSLPSLSALSVSLSLSALSLWSSELIGVTIIKPSIIFVVQRCISLCAPVIVLASRKSENCLLRLENDLTRLTASLSCVAGPAKQYCWLSGSDRRTWLR